MGGQDKGSNANDAVEIAEIKDVDHWWGWRTDNKRLRRRPDSPRECDAKLPDPNISSHAQSKLEWLRSSSVFLGRESRWVEWEVLLLL